MIDFFDYIDDYMDGKLSGDLLAQFEEALKSDSELKRAVDNYQSAKKLAGGIIEEETRTLLENLEQDEQEEIEKRNGSKGPWIIGALIVALALIYWGSQLMNQSEKTNNSEEQGLYAYNFEEPIWPIEKSNNLGDLSRGVDLGLNGEMQATKTILQNSNISPELSGYWISELFAYNKMPDSIDFYLPNRMGIIAYDKRIEYLKVLSIKSGGNEDELERYLKTIDVTKNQFITNLLKD